MRRIVLLAVALLILSVGVAVAEEPVDFGQVPVGTAANATYTFTNSGVFSCTVQAVGFGDSYFGTSGAFSAFPPPIPAELPSGGTVEIGIAFLPQTVGSQSETLLIRVQCGFFTQTIQIPLVGQGAGEGTPYAPIDRPGDFVYVPPTSDPEPGSCPCTTEIAGLQSDIAGINLYLLTQLGPSVQQLQSDLAELESCCDGDVADDIVPTCLGPFPSEGGGKFRELVASYRKVTETSADILPMIDPEQPGLQALLDDGADVVRALVADLDQLASITASLPSDQQACLDSYVPAASVDFLDTTYSVVSDASNHPKLRGLLGGTAQDTGRTILNKVGIWARQLPVIGGVIGGIIDDINELSESAEGALGIAGLLFQYEIERKLDGIIYGLFGITIPANATESQLEELLRRITNDPISERLRRLEEGLAGAEGQLQRIEEDIAEAEEQVREIERIVRDNQSELATLESKVCCFVLSMTDYTQQMGAALYGDRGAFEFLVPDVCRGTTAADCYGRTTVVPGEEPTFDAIKPEIRALEADMAWVKITLEEILRRLGGGDGDLIPDDGFPPVLIPPTVNPEWTIEEQEYYWLALTKKIYVYAEDTFTAVSGTDEREVRIDTAAFDVSGWIDLVELRPGDTAEIEIRVDIAGNDRHFMTTTFDGATDARLIPFDEFTGGRMLLVGDLMRILIRQPTSADNYATPTPIGYQFVVESQD